MHAASEAPAGIAFRRFLLLPHRRELLADDRPVKLGGRAFDVLMALVEAGGAVVTKDALMGRVWPDQIVEENNLQWQISTLRAALGADRNLIRTVSGRGYQFTADIRIVPAEVEQPQALRAVATRPREAHPGQHSRDELPSTNLPEPVSELIGRDEELGEILNLAGVHRLVTLTGPGGIGKTALALELARELRPHFVDGVWLAEFSALTHPGLVPATVAAAVGLGLGGGESSVQRVAQMLAGQQLLLVLDTCEHVVDVAAALAEALLRAGAAARMIATSREPLRVEGEWTYPVPPLAVPAADAGNADELMHYGAVQLFVERARAAEPSFAPGPATLKPIAAICGRLDGIPLAIELAAARVAALGIEELAARLDDRFGLLTGGRRTALPRHQTLRATLDWSYTLLTESERVILRRLSVFAGAFSLRAATAVAANSEISPSQVVDGLSSLLAKSLVTPDAGSIIRRYRLLDITRAYALERLTESGEREPLARRHAEYYREIFEQAEAEWETRPTAEWLADYAPRIDNLRCALDWAFSPEGDAAIGVALTAAAAPLWMQLSLIEECRGRVERALSILELAASLDARREMKLYAALAASLRYARGAVPEIADAWERALRIAERLDDPDYQLRALWGLWFFHSASSLHRTALELAERLCALAPKQPDANVRTIGERAVGVSLHYLGDQPRARRHIERAVSEGVTQTHRSYVLRFQIDQRVMATVFFARILWLQGFSDQAMRAAKDSVKDAQTGNHGISLCYALFLAACPVALAVGDLAAAEHYVRILLDQSRRLGLAFWAAWGHAYQGALVIKHGDVTAGLKLLRAGFNEIGEARSASLRLIELLMAEALGQAGQIDDGLAAIEEAIAHSECTEERWLIAELLRCKGELLLALRDPAAAVAAEDHFRQALDWARRQGALSWELRAATSLARLCRDQGRTKEAHEFLAPVYSRFTEGFDTTDLKEGKKLLDDLMRSG